MFDDRLSDVISVRIPTDLRIALAEVLKNSGKPLSEIVRDALKKEVAVYLNDPNILEDYVQRLELNLKDIELDIQNIDSKLIDLEKEYQNRKAKLELQKQKLQLQKSQIERQIQQLRKKIEEINQKREGMKKKLKLTRKVINAVMSLFYLEEPLNEEIAEIVNKVGRFDLLSRLEEVKDDRAQMRETIYIIVEKLNELESILNVPRVVLEGILYLHSKRVYEIITRHFRYIRDYLAEARAWLIKHGGEEYALDSCNMG